MVWNCLGRPSRSIDAPARPKRATERVVKVQSAVKYTCAVLSSGDVARIEPGEYPQVLQVWEASVRATHHFVTEADIAVFRPMIETALPTIRDLNGIRDPAGRIAGFIAVVGGKVEMLFVHPRYRGKGVGKRLLRHAIATLGVTDLDVNEANPQAIGFYEHLGFQVVGRSPLDGTGKPYPLLHMRFRAPEA